MTDLQHHIENQPLADTHEHQHREDHYVNEGPDVLQDLFDNYVAADLAVAGASQEAINRANNAKDPDIAGRFEGIRAAWERCQFTGYGEAVRVIAKRAYGTDQITLDAIASAADKNREMRRPGERVRLLREVGKLHHIQVDDFSWNCKVDDADPKFVHYDLSWFAFAAGQLTQDDLAELARLTGIKVVDLKSLREAAGALMDRAAKTALAVKTQHAYPRTLKWEPRQDADAGRVLEKAIAGAPRSEDELLMLGDWGLSLGAELCARHGLPMKIHTGYKAGYGNMALDPIRPAHLCSFVAQNPRTKFVLMHFGYPYCDELIAMAKHFPNVYVDLCWAWSMNPQATREALRRYLHAAPVNKLFCFGGDTRWPNAAIAYATQARHYLSLAMEDEVREGLLTEKQAMAAASRWMLENQLDAFRLA